MKRIIFLLAVLVTFTSQSQIVVDNNVPYNSPAYLVDDILLGGGVTATNHVFQECYHNFFHRSRSPMMLYVFEKYFSRSLDSRCLFDEMENLTPPKIELKFIEF